MSKSRKQRLKKPQKALIKQCSWCKKPLLKAGDYIKDNRDNFCSMQCQKESNTRKDIIALELEGQKSVVTGSGVKVGTIKDPLSKINNSNFISITDLEGKTESEIFNILDSKGIEWKHKTKKPIILLGLIILLLLATIAFISTQKNTFRKKVKQNKEINTKLKKSYSKKISKINKMSYKKDTIGIVLLFPKDGYIENRKYINIFGKAQENMAVSLFLDGVYKNTKKSNNGHFEFNYVRLKRGLNQFVLKGLSTSKKIYIKEFKVYQGDTTKINIETKVEVLNIKPKKRNINYSKKQRYVRNSYAYNLNYNRGPKELKEIALTFDGGSHISEVNLILDTLKAYGKKTTVFLTGEFIRKYPKIVKRFYMAGHAICNHTEHHYHYTDYENTSKHTTRSGVTKKMLVSELKKVESRLDALGVKYHKVWRAPYGELNKTILKWAEDIGYIHAGWTQGRNWRSNLDTNDWVVAPKDRGYFSADEVYTKLTNFGTGTDFGLNGGIILMHLGCLRKEDKVTSILGKFIRYCDSTGYNMVTIPNMINKDKKI